MKKYEELKLENQLCFPLYACAKEIVRHYRPYLDEINLTYTQYITMMVLWSENEINVKDLGKKLYLDSGTLTPLLKQLEAKEYITRTRSKDDERVLDVKITEKGLKLREKASKIPQKMTSCVKLTEDEAKFLYSILYKLLGTMD
ncbi:MAG: MarR family transcriptional regulator [Acholeplasmatales bacterium]|nr:MarR family transcriptional regulator [Acholeplasmatales bacterium]